MKNTSRIYLLVVIASITAVSTQLYAQKLNKDAVAFTKSYQDNYNNGNLAALMTMYPNEVTQIYANGQTEKVPKSDYERDYIRDFGESIGTFFTYTIKSAETLPDGKIKISGAFDGYDYERKSNKKLNPTSGTFENVIAKDGGKWKFSQLKNMFTLERVFREVRDLSLNFQEILNKEDIAAIKPLFTADGVWITPDGKSTKGADSISARYAEAFKNSNVSSTIKLANIQLQFDSSAIATGTYSIYGISSTGTRIMTSGSYINKLAKENGQWKLAELKQGGLVKTVAYQKVTDIAKWKTVFNDFRRIRRDAGELSFEVSTLADDPNTVWIISEWETTAKAKEFFALPELAANRKQAGETGEPHILYLDKK